MLGEIWVVLVALMVLAGLLSGQSVLLILALLVLLAEGVSRLWSRWALTKVEYRRMLSARRAFIGETVELTIEVTNRKPLPLTWLHVRDEVPLSLVVSSEAVRASPNPMVNYLSKETSLSWYQRVSWRYSLKCTQRGYHLLGPARMRSGDIFGLMPTDMMIEDRDYVLVYPKTIPLPEMGLPEKRPFGDIRSSERLFEDPSRIMGLRDYQYGDPLKRIDWKATARHGALRVKVYEPTTTLHIVVILDIDTYERAWQGYNPVLLERAITVAASIAQYAWENRWAVGFMANGGLHHTDQHINVPPGRAPDQLVHILEALAMVNPFSTSPVTELLREESLNLPWGSTVVVVSGLITEALWGELAALREAGHPVTLLYVGDGPAIPPEVGIHVYRLAEHLKPYDGILK